MTFSPLAGSICENRVMKSSTTSLLVLSNNSSAPATSSIIPCSVERSKTRMSRDACFLLISSSFSSDSARVLSPANAALGLDAIALSKPSIDQVRTRCFRLSPSTAEIRPRPQSTMSSMSCFCSLLTLYSRVDSTRSGNVAPMSLKSRRMSGRRR